MPLYRSGVVTTGESGSSLSTTKDAVCSPTPAVVASSTGTDSPGARVVPPRSGEASHADVAVAMCNTALPTLETVTDPLIRV